MAAARRIFLLIAILISAWALSPAGPPSPGLEKKHQTWLKDEVNYLITGAERDLFLALKTPWERDAFINSFWARRDPFPLTAANEFKDEHYRRLAEAKSRYGIHTDRGRIFILLGRPDSIESEASGKIVFPCEVWNYFNLSMPGFPNSLRLLFFKQWGVGQYRLYSPLFDGLEYLVPQRHYDFRQGDDARIRNLIQSFLGIDFLLATQSVTTGTDRLESERILATLRDPDAFEALRSSAKPLVTTTVSLEKLPFAAGGFFSGDGRGNYRFDASVSVSPGDLTFERSGDKFYGRQDIYVTIRDGGRNVVDQFNDQLGLELSETEFEAKKGYRLSYSFSHLLIPGDYSVNILLRDYASSRVGEKDLRLSLPVEGRSSPLLLAGRIEPLPPAPDGTAGGFVAGGAPFVFKNGKIAPRTEAVFGPGENIYVYFEVYRRPGDSGEYRIAYALRAADGKTVRTTEESLSLPEGESALAVEKVFSPKGLEDGAYALSARVEDARNGTTLLEESAPLTLSPAPPPPGTFSFVQDYRPSLEIHYTDLGRQSFFRRDFAGARRFFGIALSAAPGYAPAKVLMAKCHVLEGNEEAALDLLRPLAEDGAEDGEIYTILGNIYYGRKNLEQAAAHLEKAAGLSIESVEVLNFLGGVYLEMGKKDKARAAFARSLQIKADQPLVKSVLDGLDR